MQTVDLLVHHALIVTQNEQRTVIEDGAIAVQGNTIVALDTSAAIDAAYTAPKTIDARGRALFPGLLNIHTHLFQAAVKGLGEDMPVEQWVQAVTFPTAAVMTPEEAYLLALVSCLENLRSGATTVMDFMYGMRDPALHDAVIQAMLDSGLRGRYTRTIVDAAPTWASRRRCFSRRRERWRTRRSFKAQYNGAATAGSTSAWRSA
jgi:5-methylthioadenosine/S-adenosylhomocysteine deaminase